MANSHTCSDLCEIVDASKLEQCSHAVRETADDEPVKGRCISHLDQNIACKNIPKILFAGIFQNIVARILMLAPWAALCGSAVRLWRELGQQWFLQKWLRNWLNRWKCDNFVQQMSCQQNKTNISAVSWSHPPTVPIIFITMMTKLMTMIKCKDIYRYIKHPPRPTRSLVASLFSQNPTWWEIKS